MSHEQFSRRDVLKIAGMTAVGMAGIEGVALAHQASPAAAAKRVLRIAHLTDVHVQPERRAAEGWIACLHHVQSLNDKPQLILTGGDSVFDSFEADDARATLQWDLWSAALKNENGIPVRSAIGNHDVWGGNKIKSKTTGEEPNYGKRRAIEMLHLSDRYYTFDQAGWRFIVLDSTQPDDAGGYAAFLDEPQFDWLSTTLRDTPATMPVLILSHIPILTVTTLLWAKQEEKQFRIDASLMHADCVKIKDLFAKYPNVKVCLSGHLHLIDRVDYNSVTYLCNGAVSANWWKGRHKDCDEGYGVMDLFDDGSFAHDYVKYGWQAAPA
ncbi:MAG TPA: metallophosphoesterase [Phycisphaerales bacterium]|nr:metallophosphoesterase [Phycisphaerales bacterium]